MSDTTGGTKRRATPQRGGTATAEVERRGRGRRAGVPQRALADGIVERRRTPRRRPEAAPQSPEAGESIPRPLSATEHYRVEMERRAHRVTGDLASLLAEAKAEYEAQLAAPRPAGKGGRPRKKKPADEFDLSDEDALGREGSDE